MIVKKTKFNMPMCGLKCIGDFEKIKAEDCDNLITNDEALVSAQQKCMQHVADQCAYDINVKDYNN